MTKRAFKRNEVLARLLASGFVSLALVKTGDELSRWSSSAKEIRWTLIDATVAIVAIACLIPLLMRGDRGQRVLGAILIVWPMLHLLGDLGTAIKYTFSQ